MPNCYYYDEQRNHCNCYVNENLNELLEENVNLRVQLANAMVTVRRVDERCAKLRELVQDYDAMLAIAAKKEAATNVILPLDAVVNALRIRAGLLGIEVDG